MITTRVTVLINRPPDEVFAYVTTVANFPKWAGALVTEARQTSPGPLHTGSTFMQANRFLIRRFKTRFEVAHYEPPRHYQYRSTAGPVKFAGNYTFEAVGNGTRFTSIDNSDLGGLLRLLEPLLQPIAQRQIETNLGNVKRLLETAAPAPGEGRPPARETAQ
jgi:uncharacterized protein YndB with AHSA1/START domain